MTMYYQKMACYHTEMTVYSSEMTCYHLEMIGTSKNGLLPHRNGWDEVQSDLFTTPAPPKEGNFSTTTLINFFLNTSTLSA
jgi:hypothetical protein